jgi:hypothetical protein
VLRQPTICYALALVVEHREPAVRGAPIHSYQHAEFKSKRDW